MLGSCYCDYTKRAKKDVVAIVWKIEISLVSAKVQAVLILKSRIIMEYLWRERRQEKERRMKWAQSFLGLWGSVKRERERELKYFQSLELKMPGIQASKELSSII